MASPLGDDDGFTVVKDKSTIKQEKRDQKTRSLEERRKDVLTYFSTSPWGMHEKTVIHRVGTLTRIDRQDNVHLHVTVNLADLEEAVKGGDLGHVRKNVRYHVTVELGDSRYWKDNPRWRPGSGWEGSAADRDAINELREADGRLLSEVTAALTAAEKAVRG